jgi:tRNA modification GTPase
VTLRDTAGIRPTDDPVEQEGVSRARSSLIMADLALWVLDAQTVDAAALAAVAEELKDRHTRAWFVVNKTDLVDASRRHAIGTLFPNPRIRFLVSAATGEGIDALIGSLGDFAGQCFSAETVLVTRERHRQMLDLAWMALAGALAIDQAEGAEGREELIAEQVRMATRALERLTGRVDVEEVLDVLFREFCVGK